MIVQPALPLPTVKTTQVRERQLEKAYKQIANSMEEQMINIMIKGMYKTVGKVSIDSTALSYYRGLLKDEYSKALTHSKNSLGISKMILKQIYPKGLKE